MTSKRKFLMERQIHINQYNTDKQNLHKNIGDIDKKIQIQVTTTILNTKISKVDEKVPYNSQYITTQEFNMLTAEKFAARLKQADLVNKTDFDNKLTSFNRRITSNKTKYLEVPKKINSVKTEDYNLLQAKFILQIIINCKTCLFFNQHLIPQN